MINQIKKIPGMKVIFRVNKHMPDTYPDLTPEGEPHPQAGEPVLMQNEAGTVLMSPANYAKLVEQVKTGNR